VIPSETFNRHQSAAAWRHLAEQENCRYCELNDVGDVSNVSFHIVLPTRLVMARTVPCNAHIPNHLNGLQSETWGLAHSVKKDRDEAGCRAIDKEVDISALTGGSYYPYAAYLIIATLHREICRAGPGKVARSFLSWEGWRCGQLPVFVGCQHRNTGKLNIGARARHRLDILLSVPAYTCAKPPSTNSSVPVM